MRPRRRHIAAGWGRRRRRRAARFPPGLRAARGRFLPTGGLPRPAGSAQHPGPAPCAVPCANSAGFVLAAGPSSSPHGADGVGGVTAALASWALDVGVPTLSPLSRSPGHTAWVLLSPPNKGTSWGHRATALTPAAGCSSKHPLQLPNSPPASSNDFCNSSSPVQTS